MMQDLNESELESVVGGVAVAAVVANILPVVAVSNQSSTIRRSVVIASNVDNGNTAIQNSTVGA